MNFSGTMLFFWAHAILGHNMIVEKSYLTNKNDKPWWTKSCDGKFCVKTSWELLRQRDEIKEDFTLLWSKGLPFKYSFLTWRIWLRKIPIAALMHKWNPNISKNCNCCTSPEEESIENLFFKGETTITIWRYFSNAIGFQYSQFLKPNIRKWWSIEGNGE